MVRQRLRLKSCDYNGLYNLFLSQEWGRMSRNLHLLLTPRSSVRGLIQAIHSSLTLPMSHYKYNEWLEHCQRGRAHNALILGLYLRKHNISSSPKHVISEACAYNTLTDKSNASVTEVFYDVIPVTISLRLQQS